MRALALAAGFAVVATPRDAAAQAVLPAIDVCSGVSVTLPTLTQVPNASLSASLPILGGIGLTVNTAPISGAINGVVNGVNANIVDQLSGRPLSVGVFDPNGHLISVPNAGCSVAVNNPNGITLGGGRIDGLGGNNPPASAGDASAIAIGNGASTSTGIVNALAFGTGASATTAGAVALGAGSVANRLNAPAEGFTATGLRPTLGVASIGAPGDERQLTNVAGGTADTDAVNVRQLRSVGTSLATSLGGGAAFAPGTGAFTAPTYTVQGTGYGNVGAAIGALDTGLGTTNTNVTNLTNNINNGTIGLVQQDAGTRTITVGAGTDGTLVSVAGTSGTRQIRGLAAGTGATDAVNVTQLNTAISGVTPGALAIASENSGGAPVPTATGLRSVAVGYGSTAAAADTFSVGAPGAERRIVNVGAGTVAAGSTDGVNGGQLFAVRQGVIGATAALGGGAAYDPATGAFTAPTFTVQGTGYGNVGAAIGALDTGLGTTNTNLTNLTTNITNGTIGLVRQDPGTRAITVGAATDGALVSVSGTSGNRQVRGVAAGTAASDAVNVTQLDNAIGGVAPGALAVASENSGGAAAPTATRHPPHAGGIG